MEPIRSLEDLVPAVQQLRRVFRVAVACGEDPNTVGAVAAAAQDGIVQAVMLGRRERILSTCREAAVDPTLFVILDHESEASALAHAVTMVREGDADILMKGLVGTDAFLRAVMAPDTGLLAPKSVMSYVCAVEVPAYRKLLFLTDTAVLPFPDLAQKITMTRYAVAMAQRLGVERPKVALLSAVEKPSEHFPSHQDHAVICTMADRGQFGGCVVDGPLDLFLACDPASLEIKGVSTPIEGDADVLVFPSLEAANIFYKGLMLFAGGELAGLLQGTTRPVVVMSRSESPTSKLYCLALACLMAP